MFNPCTLDARRRERESEVNAIPTKDFSMSPKKDLI